RRGAGPARLASPGALGRTSPIAAAAGARRVHMNKGLSGSPRRKSHSPLEPSSAHAHDDVVSIPPPPFSRIGPDTFIAFDTAEGPWTPGFCHGGAPAGLIVHAADAVPAP